jgi:hypothetical protein
MASKIFESALEGYMRFAAVLLNKAFRFSSYRYGQPFGSQANITGGKYRLDYHYWFGTLLIRWPVCLLLRRYLGIWWKRKR